MQNNIEAILQENKIIPVVTIQNESEIDTIYQKLSSKGIHCIEITLRTPYAFEAIAEFKKRYGFEFKVGVGTVIKREQVEKCKALKVDFMVSPGLTADLARELHESKIPFLPGGVTPSEIITGQELDVQFFKFFPANLFGGLQTLEAYETVFKGVKFCPTGGINESNYKDFLRLENVVSVGGTWVLR
ncbi:MAG: bifunctional 4-hydroxy-2-oxoglutarate aldolase/2-dehydro-3-deoxy-phosphogluconate aldolase [Bacteroidetes bacterium]|nr:bifunctional 4-hydroxy-2-oxoglutarate aldolase/2-dehydro-3-deoxy-phosphogluconate aldolase [Bacteroidota bacterium]